MPRTCTVCRHPKRGQIDEALARKLGTLDTIARRFAIGRASVHRHSKACLPQALAAAVERIESGKPSRLAVAADAALLTAQELFEKLQLLVAEAFDILADAKSDGDRHAALKALREARETIRLLGTAQGHWRDGTTVTVDARRQSVQLFANLSEDEIRSSLLALRNANDNRALSVAPQVGDSGEHPSICAPTGDSYER